MSSTTTVDTEKAKVAAEVVKRFKSGEVVGFGSGSTAEVVINLLAERIKSEKLTIAGVATSYRTALLASAAGIQILSVGPVELDWGFDGADEVDPQSALLKGAGAAMLSEKLIAKRTKRWVIVVTKDKFVKNLGEKFPVPVEVIPSAASQVERELTKLGAKEVVLRAAVGKYGPIVTEHGNLILDARFPTLSQALDHEMHYIPGVVETGLFYGYSPELVGI